MRKLFLLSVAILITLGAHSQFGEGTPSTYEDWKERTLVVVHYPFCTSYNNAVDRVVKDRWIGEKVDYVDYVDLGIYKKRKDIVYLSVKNWYGDDLSRVFCFTTTIRSNFYNMFYHEKSGWAYTQVGDIYNWDAVEDWKKKNASLLPKRGLSFGSEVCFLSLSNYGESRIEIGLNVLFNTLDKFKKGYSYRSVKKGEPYYNLTNNLNTIKEKTLDLL